MAWTAVAEPTKQRRANINDVRKPIPSWGICFYPFITRVAAALLCDSKRVAVDSLEGDRTTHSCVTDGLDNTGESTDLVNSGVGLAGAWGFAERTRGMSAAYTPAAKQCQYKIQFKKNPVRAQFEFGQLSKVKLRSAAAAFHPILRHTAPRFLQPLANFSAPAVLPVSENNVPPKSEWLNWTEEMNCVQGHCHYATAIRGR